MGQHPEPSANPEYSVNPVQGYTMKKIGLLLVVVLLAGAGAAYFFSRSSVVPADTGYADYLPPDTPVTISLRDLNELTDLFPKTALGHFLSKETMHRMLSALQVKNSVIRSYEKVCDQLSSVVRNPGFRMVFGDDVDLALLPVDADLFGVNPQQAMERSMVVLATSSSSRALETFARTLLHKDVGEFISGELSLTRIKLDEKNTVYAYTEGSRLILAYDPAAVKRCLAAKTSGKNLLKTDSFIAAVNFWQTLSMTKKFSRSFVQLDRLQPYFLASKDKNVRETGRYLKGMQFVATAGGQFENGWKAESFSRYDYAALDPAVRELIDSAGGENGTLQLLDNSPLLYSWSSSLGSSSLLETLAATEGKQYDALDQRLQREVGFSLAQVVQAFGPQYGLLLKEIVQEGMFPFPRIVLFLEVKDQQVAKALLARIRQKAADRGLTGEQRQQVGNYTIYSWALLPGQATRPAVVLTEDMLYLANGPDSLQRLLSAQEDRFRLPESVAGTLGPEVAGQIASANNGVFLFWPSRFADQVQNAADWLGGMVEASRGGSISALKDELLLLLQSGEVAVFVSDLFPDHGRASVIVQEKMEKEVAL